MKYFTLLLLPFVTSTIIKYKECKPNPNSEITSVDISPCRKSPCKLHQGQTYSLTVNFKSKVKSSSLKAKVCGKVGPVCIPFSLPNSDACTSLTCPIQEDQDYSYSTSL